MRKPDLEREHLAGMGGYQKIFRFANNRGASVVRIPGLVPRGDGEELSQVIFVGPEILDMKSDFSYPTVRGGPEKIETWLAEIELLSPPTAEEIAGSEK